MSAYAEGNPYRHHQFESNNKVNLYQLSLLTIQLLDKVIMKEALKDQE
jgi:hypothetical protein